jgi:hypothetical protein
VHLLIAAIAYAATGCSADKHPERWVAVMNAIGQDYDELVVDAQGGLHARQTIPPYAARDYDPTWNAWHTTPSLGTRASTCVNAWDFAGHFYSCTGGIYRATRGAGGELRWEVVPHGRGRSLIAADPDGTLVGKHGAVLSVLLPGATDWTDLSTPAAGAVVDAGNRVYVPQGATLARVRGASIVDTGLPLGTRFDAAGNGLSFGLVGTHGTVSRTAPTPGATAQTIGGIDVADGDTVLLLGCGVDGTCFYERDAAGDRTIWRSAPGSSSAEQVASLAVTSTGEPSLVSLNATFVVAPDASLYALDRPGAQTFVFRFIPGDPGLFSGAQG